MAVPYLFRSYIHPKISGSSQALNPSNFLWPFQICEVARATSAAPGYFSKVRLTLHQNSYDFMDGGIRANNPSLVAWNEVLQMARHDNPSITGAKAVGCFVSVGTGKSKYQIFGRETESAVSKYLNMNKAPRKMLTDTVRNQVFLAHFITRPITNRLDQDPNHVEMKTKAGESCTPYFRFNVKEGLADMMLDEWKETKRKNFDKKMSTIEYLEAVTNSYLDMQDPNPDPQVSENITAVAKVLVNYRKAREENQIYINGTAG
jgi:patatin-like phospholipase/acyl hydrolase